MYAPEAVFDTRPRFEFEVLLDGDIVASGGSDSIRQCLSGSAHYALMYAADGHVQQLFYEVAAIQPERLAQLLSE